MPGGIAQPLRVTAQRKPSRGTTAAGRKRPWRAALYGANAVAPWGDSKPPHPTIQLHPVLASAARRPWSASWAGGVSDESPHGAKPAGVQCAARQRGRPCYSGRERPSTAV